MSVRRKGASKGFVRGPGGGCVKGPASVTPPAIGKALLTSADLTYLGRFQPPISGRSALWWECTGLSGRVVEGQFRLMAIIDRLSGATEVWLREFVPPSSLASYPSKTAEPSITREWRMSDVLTKASSNRLVEGAWVDPDTQDLYWSHQGASASYSNAQNQAVLGRSTWNAGTETWTHEGIWSMGTAIGSKITTGAFMEIPEWFRTATGITQRLGCGMGSYRSVVNTGPASLGPALVAFAPPTGASGTDVDSAVQLVNYKANLGVPANRDTDTAEVVGSSGAWTYLLPSGGHGVWGWNDWAWSSGLWIDTPTKSGLLVIAAQTSVGGEGNGGISTIAADPAPTNNEGDGYVEFTLDAPIIGLAIGDFIGIESTFSNQNGHGIVSYISGDELTIRCTGWPQNPPYNSTTWAAPYKPKVGGWVCRGTWYSMANIHSTMWRHKAYIYDPEDLAAVAVGAVQPSAIQAAERWDWEVDGFTYPSTITRSSSSNGRSIYGMAFDPTTRRLYMVTPEPASNGLHRTIEVWEVAE